MRAIVQGLGDDAQASAALTYIRGNVLKFRQLGARIRALQHRAALAKPKAVAAGRPDVADSLARQIQSLGRLNSLHGSTVDKIDELNTLLAKHSIPGLGAIFVPVAAAAIAIALAGTMVYLFTESNNAEKALQLHESLLAQVKAGTLTPEEAAKLGANLPQPSQGLTGLLAQAGKTVMWGLVAALAVPPLLSAMKGR